jgi:hypothetical protein
MPSKEEENDDQGDRDSGLTSERAKNMPSKEEENDDQGEKSEKRCSTKADKGTLAITHPRPNDGAACVAEGK